MLEQDERSLLADPSARFGALGNEPVHAQVTAQAGLLQTGDFQIHGPLLVAQMDYSPSQCLRLLRGQDHHRDMFGKISSYAFHERRTTVAEPYATHSVSVARHRDDGLVRGNLVLHVFEIQHAKLTCPAGRDGDGRISTSWRRQSYELKALHSTVPIISWLHRVCRQPPLRTVGRPSEANRTLDISLPSRLARRQARVWLYPGQSLL